jgi:hypothetical protein
MPALLAIGPLSRARPVNPWPPRSASHRRTAGSLARQSLQAGMPGPTTPTRTRPSRRLPPRWRNLLLTTHVVVAVGVLGTDLVLLTLGTTALVSGDPELVRASYLAMGLLADAVLEPLALAAPLTGILVGLGTAWGLTRHTWVLAKLVLTIGVATAAVLVLRPALHRAAEQALQVSLAELSTTAIGRCWPSPQRVTSFGGLRRPLRVQVTRVSAPKGPGARLGRRCPWRLGRC